jgi:LL-diaminopimelate aminotransferase
MIATAERIQNLTDQFFPAINEKIFSLRERGADIIRLDIGSPDMPPPPWVIEAMVKSTKNPLEHGYQPGNSTPSLRKAWATMYQRDHQVHLEPDLEVLPLIGTKEGIFHLSMAMLNPGDIALVPDPGYLTYRQGALCAEAVPYPMPLLKENNYLSDFDQIPEEILQRARILWLNYPHNPTASIAPLAFFKQAVAFARQHHLLLCHDAAYLRIVWDGGYAPSLLEVKGAKEVAVEFNSLSKTYNMAGWRVGAVVGQAKALQCLRKLKAVADSGHFSPIQTAAEEALLGDQSWVQERNMVYQHRRELVVSRLNKIGLESIPSSASLYVWFKTPAGIPSKQFTQKMLEQAHVSLAPGIIFGNQGENWVRLAFTTPADRLEEALNRMERYL